MSEIIKTHEKILKSIEDNPKIQRDICVNTERSVVYRHLQRAVKNKEIGFIVRPDNKSQNREVEKVVIAMKGYERKKKDARRNKDEIIWSENCNHLYFRTKLSQNLFRQLKKKYSEDKHTILINEIVDVYRGLEIMALEQKGFLTSRLFMSKHLKKLGKDPSEEAINDLIAKNKADVEYKYKFRNKLLNLNFGFNCKDLTEEDLKQFLLRTCFASIKDGSANEMLPWIFIAFLTNNEVKNSETNERKAGVSNLLLTKIGLLMTLK